MVQGRGGGGGVHTAVQGFCAYICVHVRRARPSNPPAAPQQQTNNSLNFKQLLCKAATSQQLCGRAKKPDLHDTMTRCTGQHANNHHTSTQRCVSRPAQLAQPPERGEKPSAENVTGADTQPSPKGKCQRHKCQADHQNNTLCHLPLPVATSSRKSRTKISPPL